MTTKPTGAEQKQLQPTFRRDTFAALLFTLGALVLAYQIPQQYDLNTRGVVLDGFHASEGSGSRRFRWTDGHASAHFEGIGSRPYRLVLGLSGPRPSGLQSPSAHIVVNGIALGGLSTTSAPQTFNIPSVGVGLTGSLDVQIDSDTFVPPNDLRTLGVVVSELRVEPVDGSGVTWPAPLALALGAGAVTAVFLAAGVAARREATPSPTTQSGARRWAGPLRRPARPHARLEAARRHAAWPAALLVLGVLVGGLASERVLAASLMPWIAFAAASVYIGLRIKQYTTWAETAAALAVLLSLAHFVLAFLNLFAISRFTDVTTMFEAAQKLSQGLDPYDYGVIRDNPLYAHSYVYPPAFAQFLGLLLPLGMQGAIVSWVVLNFLLYLGTIVWLLRFFGLRFRTAGMYAMLLVAFNYQPVIDTLYGGQLDILILALLLLSLALALQGRLASSGVALAFAAITKLHPLLLLPFYLVRERLRAYLGFGMAFAFIVAVSLALSPPDLYARYATVVLPGRGGGGTGNAENQSLSGFFFRAAGLFWSDLPTGEQERVLRFWTYGAGALLGIFTLGVVLYSLTRSKDGAGNRMLSSLHFAVFIALMLLILPTSWMHYETQLLLPLAALLAYAVASRQREARAVHPVSGPPADLSAGVSGQVTAGVMCVVWGIAACLTAFANQEIFRGGEFDAWPLSLIQSYKLYGVLLVWGALLWAIIREGRAGSVRRAAGESPPPRPRGSPSQRAAGLRPAALPRARQEASSRLAGQR